VLVDVLRRFDADGVEPDTLSVREPSLDDVFLSLTGHRAEPGDATGGAA
jgi:ABC-2 type transport system ATP-binding protein